MLVRDYLIERVMEGAARGNRGAWYGRETS